MVRGTTSFAPPSPLDSPLSPLAPTPVQTPDYHFDYVKTALDFTNQNFPSLSGTPQVLLTRTITINQLNALVSDTQFAPRDSEPPLVLVLLKGDFRAKGYRNIGFDRASYIWYVFDLNCKCITIKGVDGGGNQIQEMLALVPATPTPLP